MTIKTKIQPSSFYAFSPKRILFKNSAERRAAAETSADEINDSIDNCNDPESIKKELTEKLSNGKAHIDQNKDQLMTEYSKFKNSSDSANCKNVDNTFNLKKVLEYLSDDLIATLKKEDPNCDVSALNSNQKSYLTVKTFLNKHISSEAGKHFEDMIRHMDTEVTVEEGKGQKTDKEQTVTPKEGIEAPQVIQKEIDGLNKQHTEFMKNAAGNREKIQALEEKVSQLRKAKDEAESTLEGQNKGLTQDKDNLGKTNGNIGIKEGEISNLDGEIDQTENELGIPKQVERLTQSADQAQLELDDLTQQILSAGEDFEAADQAIKKAQETVGKMRVELTSIEEGVSNMEINIGALEGKIAHLDKGLQKITENIEHRDQIKQAEVDLKKSEKQQEASKIKIKNFTEEKNRIWEKQKEEVEKYFPDKGALMGFTSRIASLGKMIATYKNVEKQEKSTQSGLKLQIEELKGKKATNNDQLQENELYDQAKSLEDNHTQISTLKAGAEDDLTTNKNDLVGEKEKRKNKAESISDLEGKIPGLKDSRNQKKKIMKLKTTLKDQKQQKLELDQKLKYLRETKKSNESSVRVAERNIAGTTTKLDEINKKITLIDRGDPGQDNSEGEMKQLRAEQARLDEQVAKMKAQIDAKYKEQEGLKQ